MLNRLIVSGLGMLVSVVALTVEPSDARAGNRECSVQAGFQATPIRGPNAGATNDCFSMFCTYSCDSGPTPGNSWNCPSGCSPGCGSFGNYCSSGCVVVVCTQNEQSE